MPIISVRESFVQRATHTIERIAASASEQSLLSALAATTGVGTLARALGDPDVVGPAEIALEPLAPAIARNAEHRRELLEAAGGAFTASKVGEILGISRQAVDKQRRAGSLLAFRRGSDWQYPACQFSDGDAPAGLAEVLRELNHRDPWLTLDFLLSEDSVLGGLSPLEALKKGDEWREQVLRLARAERGEGPVLR